jgi:hypothetical protein
LGYPVIVETKLWRNSEAKREVVAQVIDYAAKFSKWAFSKFDEVCKQKTNKGILDFLQDSFDLDPEEMPDEDKIAKNLRQGRFLLLIVGDKIQHSVIDMMAYINQYPGLSTNIGMIELQTYQVSGFDNDILVVPNIVAKTEIVERSVVQVTITPDVAHQIEVEQKIVGTEGVTKRAKKQILSNDAFWEIFSQNVSPRGLEVTKDIYEKFDSYPDIEMQNRRTAIVTRIAIPDTNRRISLFYINIDGTISCQKSNIQNKLIELGYPPNFTNEYYVQLAKLFSDDPSAKNIKQEVDLVDPMVFIAIVGEFIQKIHSSDIQLDDE